MSATERLGAASGGGGGEPKGEQKCSPFGSLFCSTLKGEKVEQKREQKFEGEPKGEPTEDNMYKKVSIIGSRQVPMALLEGTSLSTGTL